jgi:hypothetical protein
VSKVIGESEDRASSIIAGRIPLLQRLEKEERVSKSAEAMDAYILAYYYSALTNLFCQACLTSEEQASDAIQLVIQASHADFQTLDLFLEACSQEQILASPNSNLYEQVRHTLKEQVKEC